MNVPKAQAKSSRSVAHNMVQKGEVTLLNEEDHSIVLTKAPQKPITVDHPISSPSKAQTSSSKPVAHDMVQKGEVILLKKDNHSVVFTKAPKKSI